ncbi:hypothetical protein H696_01307 [Fonticula alba]|uniref:Small ribosomal subunit protein mS38 n=1 Tax=Fonticula alba TaxID=691883 RepID=A0A058ZD90_FONAL|nr:hypothetical protein H696_01307 [Fonticula alba]KCV71898.1 hypothetical protein H696_01307 [Fonticula alba]|eukprot:XP_009493476.1 hypothetical protein H696_01307 [Fonticula alba]
MDHGGTGNNASFDMISSALRNAGPLRQAARAVSLARGTGLRALYSSSSSSSPPHSPGGSMNSGTASLTGDLPMSAALQTELNSIISAGQAPPNDSMTFVPTDALAPEAQTTPSASNICSMSQAMQHLDTESMVTARHATAARAAASQPAPAAVSILPARIISSWVLTGLPDYPLQDRQADFDSLMADIEQRVGTFQSSRGQAERSAIGYLTDVVQHDRYSQMLSAAGFPPLDPGADELEPSVGGMELANDIKKRKRKIKKHKYKKRLKATRAERRRR